MLALDRLRGLRVIADASALDAARWEGSGEVAVLRFAPDDVFAENAAGWEKRRNQAWKGQRRPRKLGAYLFQVIQVKVAVAAGPDEFAGLEVALLGDHVHEQRVRRDVEWHTQQDVRAALV